MNVRKDRRQMVAAIGKVIAGACGRDSQYADVGIAVLTRVGNALLSQIQQDFIVKSRRGVGRDGIQWPELSPVTVARRTVSKKDEAAIRKELKEMREKVFNDEIGRLRAGSFSSFNPRPITKEDERIDERLIKQARRYAKEVIDAVSKQFRREKLSQRQVDILRDTGAMLRAFTPGVGDRQSWEGKQIFDVGYGQVTVGNREKPWHQLGGGRLPARPSWPQDNVIPDAWWPPIVGAAERGLRDGMIEMIRRGRNGR